MRFVQGSSVGASHSGATCPAWRARWEQGKRVRKPTRPLASAQTRLSTRLSWACAQPSECKKHTWHRWHCVHSALNVLSSSAALFTDRWYSSTSLRSKRRVHTQVVVGMCMCECLYAREHMCSCACERVHACELCVCVDVCARTDGHPSCAICQATCFQDALRLRPIEPRPPSPSAGRVMACAPPGRSALSALHSTHSLGLAVDAQRRLPDLGQRGFAAQARQLDLWGQGDLV